MKDAEIKEKIEKLYYAIVNEVEKLGGQKNAEKNFKPLGVIVFFFGKQKICTIGLGKINALEVMDYMADHCSSIYRGEIPLAPLKQRARAHEGGDRARWCESLI